jgi:hypothetical protein
LLVVVVVAVITLAVAVAVAGIAPMRDLLVGVPPLSLRWSCLPILIYWRLGLEAFVEERLRELLQQMDQIRFLLR